MHGAPSILETVSTFLSFSSVFLEKKGLVPDPAAFVFLLFFPESVKNSKDFKGVGGPGAEKHEKLEGFQGFGGARSRKV